MGSSCHFTLDPVESIGPLWDIHKSGTVPPKQTAGKKKRLAQRPHQPNDARMRKNRATLVVQ